MHCGCESPLSAPFFDGRVLVIERIIEPFWVSRGEAAWTKRYRTAVQQHSIPNWQWLGPEIPDHKGFFERVVGDTDGRVWVARHGPGSRRSPCDEHPAPQQSSEIARCWENTVIVDVFGPEGRFLGDALMPSGFSVYDLDGLFIRGDVLLIRHEDEAGTIMVKRYRLVLPGEP